MTTPTSTTTTTPKSSFTIREAAHKLAVSEMYLRKMVLEGKLPTTHVAISDKVWRHEISQAALDAFKARTGNRSSRDDGRNKFVVYMTTAEEKTVRESLKTLKLEAVDKLLGRANPSKATK
ncbi:MAG: hypothetical protein MUO31_11335 [Thermodesulfovibrionales bacterium]|nr:hypothetical protein [Thermodesulfovibrionales bacterium]